jgi:hypothetical protein
MRGKGVEKISKLFIILESKVSQRRIKAENYKTWREKNNGHG